MIHPGRPIQVEDVLRVSAAQERALVLLERLETRASLPIAIRMLDEAELGGLEPEDDGGLVDYSIPDELAPSLTAETC